MIRPSDVLLLSSKALTEKKARAALTILGIAIGPLAITMIYGVTSSYSDYVVSQIQGLGQNLVVVTPSQNYRLTQSDLQRIQGIPHVVDAKPFYSAQGFVQGGGKEAVFVYAVDLDFLLRAIRTLKVAAGAVPSEAEAGRGLIGWDVARGEQRSYGVGDVVSLVVFVPGPQGVSAKTLNVMVSGVLEKYGGALFLNPDRAIFVTTPTAERALGMRDWSGVLVLVDDPSNVDSVERRIREAAGGSVDVISFLAIARVASSVTSAVNFMTYAASLSAFAVAVAGVASTMITSVMERTREIGVMKAMGFTDAQVLVLVLFEGVIMGLIGAALGIAAGVLGANYLSSRGLVISGGAYFSITVRTAPRFSPQFLAEVVAMTLATGLAGSALPAYRAARIPPAEALRYE